MKKILTFATVAAMLIAASCAKDPGQLSDKAGMARVTCTVAAPGAVATKAMGDAAGEYKLYYEVRLVGETLGAPLTGDDLSGNQTVTSWPVSITFDLAKAKTYKILFWAQSSDAPEGLFTIGEEAGLQSVAIDYSMMAANSEACDAFAGCSTITPEGATSVSLDLERPFALINLGTSDAARYYTVTGGAKVGGTSLAITGTLGTAYNVATAAAAATHEDTFTFASTGSIDVYEPTAETPDPKTLTVSGTGYNYLHAVYVLPSASSALVSANYTINDNAETQAEITTLSLTNVPLAANYRTNIVGKLLTGSATYNVTLDNDFDGSKDKIASPSFASIADLNEYFATLENNADNGNIDPEVVTVTAIGETSTIVLPAVTENIKIMMPVNDPDAEITIAYADGATASQKPANLYLYVTNIKTLTADITSTHFELISGSIVNTNAVVSTSDGTFVFQQGAKVGTLTVQQGNAEVAGEVATIEVASGATSDGEDSVEGNAVQVFVANTASVEQITLNAKTDVVVEQPKDNINKVAHDNKVAVTVTTTASGSSATAQKGGQIWVAYIGADTEITATGADDDNNASSVYIEEVKEEINVVTDSEGDAEVNVNDDPEKIDGNIISLEGPDVVLMRYAVEIDANFDYTVKRTYFNPATGLFTETPVTMTFKAAAAQAIADDYIVLRQDGIVSKVDIKAGVIVDFNGYRLEATKICGIGDGKVIFRDSSFLVSGNQDSYYYSDYYIQFQNLVDFVANNFSTPYSEMDQGIVEAIIGGGASFSGEIENVELRGGSYTFNPQQYTPNGIGLYKQFAEDFYMVALVPEANVLHQDVESGMISPWWISYGDAQDFSDKGVTITNGYLFISQDDYSSVGNSFYKDWIVDYVFSFDKAVSSSTTGIWGAYSNMCFGIALPAFEAGQTQGMLSSVGMEWSYESIVNTVTAFGCGTVNLSEDNYGTTISVELRIAPTAADLTTPGHYIMVNKYDYPYTSVDTIE